MKGIKPAPAVIPQLVIAVWISPGSVGEAARAARGSASRLTSGGMSTVAPPVMKLCAMNCLRVVGRG